jgi:hypothetical protein
LHREADEGATHQRSREEEVDMAKEKFSCRACGAEFHSREELDRHNRREHAPETQPRSPMTAETPSPRREDQKSGPESIE